MSEKVFKILLVDDETDVLQFLSYNLKKEGYKIYTANNGKDAIKVAKDVTPHLIILDVMMPEMDGFHFCSWLRSNQEFKEIPVLLLTGVGEHIYESKYPLKGVMQADADEYLEKPVKPEVLLETISKLIGT